MNKFKILILVIGLTFVGACANKPIVLKPGVQPKMLELCLTYSSEINSDDKLLLLDAVSFFIKDYNVKTSNQQIQSCANGDHQTVNLVIQNMRYVTPNLQALYVIVSTLGIVYPLSGGSFGFVWIGGNTTNIGIKLSEDIAENRKMIYRQLNSSPYFLDLATMKKKHMKKFQEFLFALFDEINKKKAEQSEKAQ